MSYTGDALTILNDNTFVRIDTLKVGDILKSPTSNDGVKITNINSFYVEDIFKIKTENFYEFYIYKDSEVLLSQKEKMFNKVTKKECFMLSKPFFQTPDNIKRNSYFFLKQLLISENNDFDGLLLYSKILANGTRRNKEISIDNASFKIKEIDIEDLIEDYFYGSNIKLKNLTISLKRLPFWIDDFNKYPHQRTINPFIFSMEKQKIDYFLKSFLKENTKMYLNENQYRIYLKSKTMATQLFYLIPFSTSRLPMLEKIKKDSLMLNEKKSSSKKFLYSICLMPEVKGYIKNNQTFYQSLEKIEKLEKNIKVFTIETENNKSFYLNNLIVKK